MKLVGKQVISIMRVVHPFYQRHKSWLSPVKNLALQFSSFKRLRDAAIDGNGFRDDSQKFEVEKALQNQDATSAVPKLIQKTAITLMPVTFEEVVLFYREKVQYNDLKLTVELFGDWFEKNYRHLPDRLIVEYLETLVFSIRSLNGRTVRKMPHIDLADLRSESMRRRAYLSYIKILADNLEFRQARQVLTKALNLSPALLFQTAIVLQRKPARVELDAAPRLNLRDDVLDMLHANLLQLGVDKNIIKLISASAQAEDERIISVGQEVVCSFPEIERESEWIAHVAPILKVVTRELIALERADLASTLLERLKPWFQESAIDDIQVRLAIHSLSDEAAYSYLRAAAEDSPAARSLLGTLSWDRNDFQTARELAEQPLSVSAPLRRQIARKNTIDRLCFLEQTSKIINQAKQPEQPEGYVLLASLNCFNTLAMVAPALVELKRKKFAVGSLMKGVIDEQPPSETHVAVAELFNSLSQTREDGKIELEWEVNWPKRVVAALGINFYQGIYESLSNIYRRATISIDDEPVTTTFYNILQRCDYILRACVRIENAAKDTNKTIVLLGSNAHVAPYSIFRDFALARQLPNLRYVAVSVAYENYYTNLGSKTSGSMAVVDMTLHRNCRAPFLAIPERFERWYQDNQGSQEVHKRFEELVAKNRTGRDEGVHSSPAAAALSHACREGRRIVCCFGKILCDLAVPYDGGPAHEDMIDWLLHSVDIARENPDILLLIKPHPHELRPEIALELTEKLEDVLPENLPENVVILNHAEFNAGDLAPYLDLAVLWNGTACLELTGLGVPVVMCSHFGRYDYPVALNYPVDRADYESLFAKAALRAPDSELRKKAMGLLHYMGTKEVALPNLYSRRPITNDSIGVPTWYMDKINDYLVSGDPYMELAACRILEGVQEQSK